MHTRTHLLAPIVILLSALPVVPAASDDVVYLRNFSRLIPQDAVSATSAQGKWCLAEMAGKPILYADGVSEVTPVTYPLGLKGVYDIYVGLVEKPYAVDDAEWQGMHVKLTGDTWFTHLCGGRTGLGYGMEHAVIDEIYWKRANLTGQDIVIYQPHGRFFKPAGGISYIKLVPRSEEHVKADKARGEQTSLSGGLRDICGMADWWSYIFVKKNVEAESTRKMVLDHKASGFSSVFIQINADGVVHYPSKVAQRVYYHPSEDPRPEAKILDEMLSKHDPLQVAADESHKQGMKLLAWFRVTNEQHPESPYNEYSVKFKDMRIVGADGEITRWPSLTYKEVRDYKLAILREIVTDYKVDGLLLDYLRTMPVIGYEPHVVKAYADKYGIDPLKEPGERSRLRWKKFRAEYVTAFMRDLKKIVAEEEKRSGRRILIAARVTPQENLWKGLDVETWIKGGLIDIVVPSGYTTFDPFISIRPFKKMAEGTKCKVYPCINPFFAGGSDYGDYDPNAAQKEVADIILKRLSQGASPLEYARRVMQYYADGADGIVFYESESLAADPPMYPGNAELIPMFKKCSDHQEMLSYVKLLEKETNQ